MKYKEVGLGAALHQVIFAWPDVVLPHLALCVGTRGLSPLHHRCQGLWDNATTW